MQDSRNDQVADSLMINDAAKDVFKRFLERIPGGVFRYTASEPRIIDFLSDGMLSLMGCETREEFDDITGGGFDGMVSEKDRDDVLNEISRSLKSDDAGIVVYRLNRADGKEVWVDNRWRVVTDSAGKRWFYVTALDVTAQVETERELRRAHERMDILTALSNDIIFDIECETGIAQVFGDFEDRFGREPRQEDFVVKRRCHKDCRLKIQAKGLNDLYEEINDDSLVDFETSTQGLNGEPIWYRYQSVVLYDDDGNAVRHVGRLLDTHDMIVRESQFRRRAERDSLTGLFNRAAALNRIEPILLDGEHPFTFILIDVDDFKSVNDNFGHPEGDRVLKEISSFLVAAMRHEDILMRLGGDEFAIFAKGLEDGPALKRVVEHLSRGPFATQRETDDGNRPYASPGISMGVVYSAGGSIPFDEIYSQADAALYEAKQLGKSQAVIRQLS